VNDRASNSSVPPSGTVTFMFTDMAGSTQLVQQLQDAYATLLADQRSILRTAFEKWNGHDPLETGFSLYMLSAVAFNQGDFASARIFAEESEKILRSLGNRRNLAYTLQTLAMIEMFEGNVAQARSLIKESLTYFSELGDSWACMTTLAIFAIGAETLQQPKRAIRLGGAVATLHDMIGGAFPTGLQSLLESTVESARSALGAEAESAWEQGRSMTLEQAIEYALEELKDG
jgi:class 3 adenylate cyclase